jgi:hypothetical protein
MRIAMPKTRDVVVALFAIASTSSIAIAQQPSVKHYELRSFVGGFVPTGSQGNTLENGATMGLQGAYNFNRFFSAVGTFAYSTSQDKETFSNDDVNVFQYDIGAEAGLDRQLTSSLTLRPFLGLGMGGRAYDYNDRHVDTQYNIAGYGAGGAELRMGRYGWRLEVRDYVSGFKGLSGELDSYRTRNDLSIASGFTVRF